MTQLPADKTALRLMLREHRREHAAREGGIAAQEAAQKLCDVIMAEGLSAGAIIAAYLPLPDEISPLPSCTALRHLGFRIAMPVTTTRDAPLTFRLYDDNTPVTTGDFGVREPASGDTVTPDALIVPLLAFDDDCQRLGFGAGHYDRTLAALRAQGRVFTLGLAHDMQRMAGGLPHEDHDQPLDCVVTDKAVYWPQSSDHLKG